MSTPGLSSAAWRKSSRSGSSGTDCVEVADVVSAVAVRDSKDSAGPALAFARGAFGDLMQGIRTGRYDR
ncbi:DUF397 domain-containing protein [Thermomonospora umbrina]|uniref:Uncharacterized protein DUF397 n=1 Tax=Thermomonospora umbrina TaxID=111806 RepID=A0A3D9SSM8_9ACTN|nr:DUF397 domain-containing protein [Thermomonospora umbrina]REE95975.1 uncharacterized protein DUF397 [Thermomonospora umbrina]